MFYAKNVERKIFTQEIFKRKSPKNSFSHKRPSKICFSNKQPPKICFPNKQPSKISHKYQKSLVPKINLVTQFVHPPRLIMLLLERFSNEIKIESKVGNKVCLRISDAIFDLLTKATLFESASALLPRPLPTSMLLRK